MADTRPRILITDDREQNRYVLSRLLEQSGYVCDQASSGKEALEKLRSHPNVAIIDVHLPDMSGFDLCQRIKRHPETSQISVLQISASFVSAQDKARALEAGADGYLTHPIDGVVLVATVRSLLRLREAEMIARSTASQWQSTFDALTEGLAYVDRDSRLARCNSAFERLCGSESDCAIGADATAALKCLLGTDEPLRHDEPGRYSAEFEVGKRTIRVSVDRVQDDGDTGGKVVVLTDITDRKLAEYAVRAAEKLAATGKLAHAIAHEINNPLEALINLIYLAESSDQLPEIHEYLERASDELARISRITKQSLSFHRDTQHAVPIDVGALMGDVVALYRKVAASRQVCIAYDLRPTLSIYGFPGQLSQVLGNLLRNATEAAAPKSQVMVRVRPVHRRGHEGTRITIHDRGPGIPANVQDQMFDPFFTTKELKGSGLGLWVSRMLVLKHSGTIRFRSSTRENLSGTTFEVFLPVGGVDPQHFLL
jgi:PAS domain S-box-containing protein